MNNIKKIKKFVNEKLFSDTLIKNIAVISGGTAIGQAINAIFSPIITRIYTPEEYGLLSVFSSVLLIFSFSSFKYEMAIPIAEKKEEADILVNLSIIILTIVSFITALLLLLFSDVVLALLNAEQMIEYRLLIPLGIFLQGIYIIFRQWMFRIKNFKVVSSTKVTQNLYGNITKVLAGLLNFGGFGLIIGRIVSESAGIISFLKKYRKTNKKRANINFIKMKNVAIKYRDFPFFQATSTAVIHFRNQVPILFLAPLYGPEIVGLYGLANTIIKIPMTLIGQSVMDVFFAEVASIGTSNPRKIESLSNDLLKKLIIVGIVPILVLFFSGPTLFSLVFGEQWIQSGVFARYLSIYIFSNLIFSPISKIFEVFRTQKIKFIIDFISLILIAVVFISANIFELESEMTILLYSVSMALVYFVTFIVARFILKKSLLEET